MLGWTCSKRRPRKGGICEARRTRLQLPLAGALCRRFPGGRGTIPGGAMKTCLGFDPFCPDYSEHGQRLGHQPGDARPRTLRFMEVLAAADHLDEGYQNGAIAQRSPVARWPGYRVKDENIPTDRSTSGSAHSARCDGRNRPPDRSLCAWVRHR